MHCLPYPLLSPFAFPIFLSLTFLPSLSLTNLASPNFSSLAKRVSLHACTPLQYTSARKKEALQHIEAERVGRRVRIRSFKAFV